MDGGSLRIVKPRNSGIEHRSSVRTLWTLSLVLGSEAEFGARALRRRAHSSLVG